MLDKNTTPGDAADFLIETYTEIIKNLGAVPSGTVYAYAMGAGVTLTMHNAILIILEKRGSVRVNNHLITWIGR